jgi:hypothetical protein
VIEATGIRDVPSGPLLRIGHDRYIDGLRRVTEAIHRHSDGRTQAYIQLIDFLGVKRRPERDKYLERFLPSPRRHRAALGMEGAGDDAVRRRLLTLDDASLQAAAESAPMGGHADGRPRARDRYRAAAHPQPACGAAGPVCRAAQRARAAGFDGVELHYAHAYTMASFLSATNTRADGFGGSLAERAAPAAGGVCRGAGGGRCGLRGRLPHAGRGMHRRRQRHR